jgi:3-methyladenine DNA glycosylase AlkC
VVQHLLARKGAARIALIPAPVLEALNDGLIPTVNLNEFLALDLSRLARNVAAQIGLDAQHERLADTLAMLPAFKPVKRHEHVARALYDMTQPRPDRDAVAHALATHPSDVARCWAAQWTMFSSLPLPAKLQSTWRFAADPHFGVREIAWMAVRDEIAGAVDEAVALLLPWAHHADAHIRRFAADPHFGVREVAWMAVRDEIAGDVDAAVRLLQPWSRDADANIRRFASEATRPRGVWCAQVEALKKEPWRGLAVIEPLKSDPSRYVQNSVANWLNDASKTQPEWVEDTCTRWERGSRPAGTAYNVRRARRSMAGAT